MTKPARDGLKAQKTEKARSTYRERYESDFIIADAAARYFRAHGVSKLPSHKALQAEIEQLTAEKNAHYNEYREKKARVKELHAEKVNGVWEQRLRIHYNCVGTIEIPSALPLPTPDVSVNTRKGVVVNYAPCDVAI